MSRTQRCAAGAASVEEAKERSRAGEPERSRAGGGCSWRPPAGALPAPAPQSIAAGRAHAESGNINPPCETHGTGVQNLLHLGPLGRVGLVVVSASSAASACAEDAETPTVTDHSRGVKREHRWFSSFFRSQANRSESPRNKALSWGRVPSPKTLRLAAGYEYGAAARSTYAAGPSSLQVTVGSAPRLHWIGFEAQGGDSDRSRTRADETKDSDCTTQQA